MGFTADGRPFVHLNQTDVPPRIDGRLDEEAWRAAPEFGDFRQREPDEGSPMTERTVLKLMYDRDFLYVGLRMYDDPDGIIANTMVRDELMLHDDVISLRFDTFLDERNGFQFAINPLGNKVDALVEGGAFVPEWDGIWYAEASIDEEGWVVEFALPFKTVGFRPGLTQWGFQSMRTIIRKNELGVLVNPSLDRNVFDMTDLALIKGLEGIEQGLGLDVKPSFAARHRRERESGRRNYSGDPSLDLFYRIAPSLTGALTFNTDFAESDVDLRQINLTRFALFFPEQRDFFLQDARIFSFAGRDQGNGIPFFSRRIGIADSGEQVDLEAGGKVTGRIGRINLGALSVQMEPYDEVDRTVLSVGRVQVNVLEESTMGFIVTDGDPASNLSNSVAGLDANFRTSKFRGSRSLEANLWGQRSWTEGARGRDSAWGARLAYPNDRVRVELEGQQLGENFNPALGFVNRVGIRHYRGKFRYRIRPEGPVHTFDLLLDGSLVTDVDNHLESSEMVLTPADLANVMGDSIAFRFVAREERLEQPFEISEGVILPVDRYQFNSGQLNLVAARSRPLSGEITLGWGEFFSGHRFETLVALRWNVNRSVNASVDYEQNDVRLREGNFTTRLARFRLNLQFTPRLSWRTLVQYDNVTDTTGINSRIRWILEPGNEIFLVLNHGYEVDRSRLHTTTSQFTSKIEWTFRF